MLRATTVAAIVAATLPVLAFEPIVLTIQNDSSQTVTRLNTFGVGKDGKPVEDNLGALMEDVAAHSTGQLELGISECQKVYLAVVLDEKEDLSTTIDTCKDTTLVVSD